MARHPLLTLILLAAAVLALAVRPSWGADSNTGQVLYRAYCAECHGPEGRGDGPQASRLSFRPADLTALGRRAGDRFPAELVFRVVDGRRPVAGHGGPEMPRWGDRLKSEDEGYGEEAVRARIARLVEYLETLQAPAPR